MVDRFLDELESAARKAPPGDQAVTQPVTGRNGRPRRGRMRGASRASLAAAREQLTAALAGPPGPPGSATSCSRSSACSTGSPGCAGRCPIRGKPGGGQEAAWPRRCWTARSTGRTWAWSAGGRSRWATRGRPGRRGRAARRSLATAAAAESEGQLDDLEDELFRFGRIVGSRSRSCARPWSDRLPADGKRGLLDTLLRQGDPGRAAADHPGGDAPART